MASLTQTCATCNKQFLVIDQEQQFLKERGYPLPVNCPLCRQKRRLALRGERKLYKTTCQQCGKSIIVTFDPEKSKQKILCLEDYNKLYAETDPVIKEDLPS
ncbi:MAG: zinc-ribbon domain containing protein [bacterium]|nr:zinc-ribbon domain containing protein [bacterium]